MVVSRETRRSVFGLVVLLALQLLLMSFSTREDENVSRVESLSLRLTSPFVAIGRSIGDFFGRLSGDASDLVAAHRRADALELQRRQLVEELQRHREADAENRRLRRLLMMREALAPESVAANVIASRLTPEERILVIDVGRADGVRQDLAVVGWGGAVGKTLIVGKHQSKVRLINDPNSGVAAVVQRSRAQGTVAGTFDGRLLDMLYVPRLDDVAHGDRIVTSGLDGIFPAGFGLGRVTSIRRSPEAGTQTIRLEAEVDYRRVEEVLVLLNVGAASDRELERSAAAAVATEEAAAAATSTEADRVEAEATP